MKKILIGLICLLVLITGCQIEKNVAKSVDNVIEVQPKIEAPILNITQLSCRTNEYGWAEILGTVKNIGDAPAYYCQVYTDLYFNDELVETDWTYVDGTTISPNQQTTFKKTIIDPYVWNKCSVRIFCD